MEHGSESERSSSAGDSVPQAVLTLHPGSLSYLVTVTSENIMMLIEIRFRFSPSMSQRFYT